MSRSYAEQISLLVPFRGAGKVSFVVRSERRTMHFEMRQLFQEMKRGIGSAVQGSVGRFVELRFNLRARCS
jgi:hypothetical protein